MRYKNATQIFPAELLEAMQKYVDGEYVYIPRKSDSKKAWGTETDIRNELEARNRQICQDHQSGYDSEDLSQKYYLSLKSIQRIILQGKRSQV